MFSTKIGAQEDVYTFDYIYKMEIETPRSRKTVIDYYLPSSGGYFCSVSAGGIMIVYDNHHNRMYTYMGKNDNKIMTSTPFSLKDLVKENNRWEDTRVYKAIGYGNLLDYDCELFKMTSDNLISEVWVAKDLKEGVIGAEGSFAENAGPLFFGYILGRSNAVNDDSLEAMYSGLPLQIRVTKKEAEEKKLRLGDVQSLQKKILK
ncbi:DUF4412 domain-containing protein [Flavivirga abyssicola]|uniref:DUF4412 domain-containing protein n=1 Tax=Flavivirga abyssicola TaxID=3063533 RepID=UPI0026E00A4D|nr:DUF4412 domain-containing protein [Flavivirga sp. MEBiC07777]WVK11685.1 DUF4412 domain-containing protein [Flavivirga sp. MEBiC07777]